MEPRETIQAYCEAWSDIDRAKRRKLLEGAWADDGIYCDPLATVSGRSALEDHIAEFAERMPGHVIDLTSGVDSHDGFARFGWLMCGPDGGAVTEGVDFVTFANDGRISRVVGFFGPLPPGD